MILINYLNSLRFGQYKEQNLEADFKLSIFGEEVALMLLKHLCFL